jgi:hypothetical protein
MAFQFRLNLKAGKGDKIICLETKYLKKYLKAIWNVSSHIPAFIKYTADAYYSSQACSHFWYYIGDAAS